MYVKGREFEFLPHLCTSCPWRAWWTADKTFGWLMGSVITPTIFVLASGPLRARLLLLWLALVVVIRIVEGLLINVEAGGLFSSCAGGMPHSIFFFFLHTLHCRCQLHPSHMCPAQQCVFLEPGSAAADRRSIPLFCVPSRQKMPFLVPLCSLWACGALRVQPRQRLLDNLGPAVLVFPPVPGSEELEHKSLPSFVVATLSLIGKHCN